MNKKNVLRLYVAGDTSLMSDVIKEMHVLLSRAHKDNFQLEAVNALANPQMAIKDGILATPTLLRLYPEPPKRVLGNLSDAENILKELEMIK